jgi:hypothetical protein
MGLLCPSPSLVREEKNPVFEHDEEGDGIVSDVLLLTLIAADVFVFSTRQKVANRRSIIENELRFDLILYSSLLLVSLCECNDILLN